MHRFSVAGSHRMWIFRGPGPLRFSISRCAAVLRNGEVESVFRSLWFCSATPCACLLPHYGVVAACMGSRRAPSAIICVHRPASSVARLCLGRRLASLEEAEEKRKRLAKSDTGRKTATGNETKTENETKRHELSNLSGGISVCFFGAHVVLWPCISYGLCCELVCSKPRVSDMSSPRSVWHSSQPSRGLRQGHRPQESWRVAEGNPV